MSVLVAIASWLSGALGGLLIPFLTGLATQLYAEYQRNKSMADAGANQQRDTQQAERDRLVKEAQDVAKANAGRSDSDVDADLRRW